METAVDRNRSSRKSEHNYVSGACMHSDKNAVQWSNLCQGSPLLAPLSLTQFRVIEYGRHTIELHFTGDPLRFTFFVFVLIVSIP